MKLIQIRFILDSFELLKVVLVIKSLYLIDLLCMEHPHGTPTGQ